MFITIFYIYLIGLILSPFIFTLFNFKFKWVTKENLEDEPGNMVFLLICLIFWPISSVIVFAVTFINAYIPKE